MSARPHGQRGFTLIEVMIVGVIVAVLAAIALPSYFQYVQRSKIIEATTGLSDLRQRMEQKFLDNRTYADSAAPTCSSIATTLSAKIHSFGLTCDNISATTYTLHATGIAGSGMDAFQYTNDQGDNKVTVSVDTARGWSTNATCWVTRKDGSCG